MNTGTASFNPENLLSGPRASTQSPMEIPATAATLPTFETSREGLRYWAGQVKLCSRATLASMAMAGIHIRALRVHYFHERNPNGGRPKKPLNVSGFPDWSSMLADVAGISDPTARRWMKIADAVEAMAQAQGGDVIYICEKLPWEWTPEESERLGDTVQRLTQDKTQRELLQSDFLSTLGYVEPERINGSNNQLGINGGKKQPAASAASAHERIEGLRCLARTEFFGKNSMDHKSDFGSPGYYITHLVNADFNGEINKHPLTSLPAPEIAEIYQLFIQPFAAAFRKLAGL